MIGLVSNVPSKPEAAAPAAIRDLFCIAPDIAAEAIVAGAAAGGIGGSDGAGGGLGNKNPIGITTELFSIYYTITL